MKICYLSDANSPHTIKWCEFFRDKGYDVSVISLSKGKINGVKVYDLGVDESIFESSNILKKVSYMKEIFKLKKLIKEINPDVLHAHYASSYGLLGALTKFKPLVISLWGSDIYSFPRGSFIKKNIIKYNLEKADYILSTSNDMAREAKLYTNKNIIITPFGVDTEFFKPFEKESDDKIIVGAIKTLKELYGLDKLIRAFAIVCEKEDNVLLKIGGKGPQLEELKSLTRELNIEDKVEFLGFLSKENVVKNFNDMDIVVIPSINESFGVASIEAQAMECPVIVTNTGGLPETVENNITGYIVEVNDVDSIAENIEKLIHDNNLRESMGKKAREFVKSKYNLIDNFNEVDSLYKNILKENK